MPSRQASVPGTLAVRKDDRGLLVRHSAARPVCPKCKSDEHVVRIWHGRMKMWVCSKCFEVKSTKRKEATLLQRVLHRLPDADTVELRELMPNRKMRRRRT